MKGFRIFYFRELIRMLRVSKTSDHMNKQQSVSIGFFFIVGLALLWVVKSELSSKAVQKAEGYEITASFTSLMQLRVGDDVRMAGVRVGSVQSTVLKDRVPTAVFKIDKEFQIPSDSVASIGMAGLLGNNMVSIQMGQELAVIKPGGVIRTQVGYDVNSIINEIGALSKQVGGALANFEKLLGSGEEGEESVFGTLGKLLRENQAAIKQTVANLEIITGQIAKGEGTMGRLLMEDEVYEEIKVISAQLQRTLEQSEGLMVDARSIVQHVKAGEGTLGTLIYGERDLGAEVEALMADLRTFTTNLNRSDSTLGRLMQDDAMYGELQGVLRKASQTLDSMGDSAPISAVGAVAAPLF
jgi:phospholipid/cholesterol/gamma-HCH transport system substrate-binding protein